jgi:hypothetical protein
MIGEGDLGFIMIYSEADTETFNAFKLISV